MENTFHPIKYGHLIPNQQDRLDQKIDLKSYRSSIYRNLSYIIDFSIVEMLVSKGCACLFSSVTLEEILILAV